MINQKTLMAGLFILGVTSHSMAAESADSKTVGQKVEKGMEKTKEVISETYEDTKKGAQKGYRAVKDKTCEVINGKMECAAQKVSNKVKNAADEVKDKVN